MINSANKIIVISIIFISLFNFNIKAQDTNQIVSEIEEILVTAQRRAENIDDVPIAITVADKEALRNAGISDIRDLGNIVTGLTFAGQGVLLFLQLEECNQD